MNEVFFEDVRAPKDNLVSEKNRGLMIAIVTRTAAVQYAPEGIRVNSVHPGPFDTPMTSDVDPVLWQMFVNRVLLQPPGPSEDITLGVLSLASHESSYVTGIEVVADDGFTVR